MAVKQLNRCILISSSKPKYHFQTRAVMHFEIHVLGTGKFVFIIDIPGIVGLVKWGS